MTATYSTASTVLVAINISKHRHEVLIGIPGKMRRRRGFGPEQSHRARHGSGAPAAAERRNHHSAKVGLF